jgi:hypothetical protein
LQDYLFQEKHGRFGVWKAAERKLEFPFSVKRAVFPVQRLEERCAESSILNGDLIWTRVIDMIQKRREARDEENRKLVNDLSLIASGKSRFFSLQYQEMLIAGLGFLKQASLLWHFSRSM